MKINQAKRIDALRMEQARVVFDGAQSGERDGANREALKRLNSDELVPITKWDDISPGTTPLQEPMNQFFRGLGLDLSSLVDSTKRIKRGLFDSTNLLSTKESDIIGRLRTLNEKLALLLVYGQDIVGQNEYFIWNFKDSSNILVNQSTATYNEEAGAFTLPLIGTPLVIKVINISVLTGTGQQGNNLDKGRARNGSPTLCVDGRPDSIFEYERTGQSTKPDSLTLTLQLEFGTPSPINKIKIDLVNLGADFGRITAIIAETGTGMVPVFTPSPGSAGLEDGLFSCLFAPVVAKKVFIQLEQPYSYRTLNGRFSRQAIGIRDIELSLAQYQPEGTFLLGPITLGDGLSGIGLTQKADLLDHDFTKVDYSVSVDAGESWSDLKPIENIEAGTEIFYPTTPVSTVLLQGKISRDDSKLNLKPQASGLRKMEEAIFVSPSTSQLITKQRPQTYLEVLRTGFGCAGSGGSPLFLGRTSNTVQASILELPVKFSRDDLNVIVNGERWPVLSSFSSSEESGVLLDDTVTPNQLIFGDGGGDGNGIGGRPPLPGSEVYCYVDTDTHGIIEVSDSIELTPSCQMDKIGEATIVTFVDSTSKPGRIKAGPESRAIQIPASHRLIAVVSLGSYDPVELGDSTQEAESGFRDGRVEFKDTGITPLFTTDWENRTIYFNPPTASNASLELVYYYLEEKIVPPSKWTFHPIANKILIDPKEVAIGKGTYTVPALGLNRNVITLLSGAGSLVRGSVKVLTGDELKSLLEVEIDFMNGAQEFSEVNDDSTSGYYSIDYKKKKLYIPPGATFPGGSLSFGQALIEAEYGIGERLIEDLDYARATDTLTFSAHFQNKLTERERGRPVRNKAVIRYDAKGEDAASTQGLQGYYSPVLRQVKLIGVRTGLEIPA